MAPFALARSKNPAEHQIWELSHADTSKHRALQ
jgi:hypothetical protein